MRLKSKASPPFSLMPRALPVAALSFLALCLVSPPTRAKELVAHQNELQVRQNWQIWDSSSFGGTLGGIFGGTLAGAVGSSIGGGLGGAVAGPIGGALGGTVGGGLMANIGSRVGRSVGRDAEVDIKKQISQLERDHAIAERQRLRRQQVQEQARAQASAADTRQDTATAAKLAVSEPGMATPLPSNAAATAAAAAAAAAGTKSTQLPQPLGGTGAHLAQSMAAQELTLFVDPLPIPEVIFARRNGDIKIGAYKVQQKFHRDLPPTWVYAFGQTQATASAPGPTIMAEQGHAASIQWENHIPAGPHLLPLDMTLGVPSIAAKAVPISVHVHGAMVASASDGHPDAWWTSTGQVGPSFSPKRHVYPNVQPGATLWYHDHTAGMTRLNVAAGLAGAYLIRDARLETALRLPQGAYDVPLVLQDRSFDTLTGRLDFPQRGGNPTIHPHWNPEYIGKNIVVNGKVSPFLNVDPTKYRFRLINAANSRFFNLQIVIPGTPNQVIPFAQVATDQGFLPQPVFKQSLLIGPGERAEIVVDFSLLPSGAQVRLLNDAPAPYKDGAAPSPAQSNVMLFVVNPKSAAALAARQRSQLALALVPFAKLDLAIVVQGRYITMTEKENLQTKEPEFSQLEGLPFAAPATIKPAVGSTEVWNIINLTDDWHPFHVHFAPHQLVQRRMFNKAQFLAGLCQIGDYSLRPGADLPTCFTGNPIPADGAEVAWKDTTQVPTGMVTTLAIRFGPINGAALPFDPRQGPGYVFESHILDHEDNDMMRPFTLQ